LSRWQRCFLTAIQHQTGRGDENRKRWHLDHPIARDQYTWVLNNNWGTKTREIFKELLDLAPGGFQVIEEGDVPGRSG
jgi:hypothetical protein